MTTYTLMPCRDKWMLVGIGHCRNMHDALYCTGTEEECIEHFKRNHASDGTTLSIMEMPDWEMWLTDFNADLDVIGRLWPKTRKAATEELAKWYANRFAHLCRGMTLDEKNDIVEKKTRELIDHVRKCHGWV